MLDYNSLDPKFKEQLASRPGGEKVSNCYLCGSCTAGCPVSSIRKEYNPRRFMRMILLGMKDEVLSSPEIAVGHAISVSLSPGCPLCRYSQGS